MVSPERPLWGEHPALFATWRILIYGFDYEDLPMQPAVRAFETLALAQVSFLDRVVVRFDALVHPVLQKRQGLRLGDQTGISLCVPYGAIPGKELSAETHRGPEA